LKEKAREWLSSPQGKKVRKVVVGIAGGVVILAGVMMLFLPGPAFVVIPAGFAILAVEFPWARRAYDRVKDKLREKGWLKGDKHKLKTASSSGHS
jgi:uncharacterized protein (TIGR02611 family)